MTKFVAAAVVAFAGTANAQLLTITADNRDGTVTASADQALLDFVGAQYNLISFFNFTLVGATSTSVDATYQSPIFGFTDGAGETMQGQVDNPPLGAFINEAPSLLGTYEGEISDLIVNGQFDGAVPGAFFPAAFFYQDAQGNAGDVAFAVEIIPAPASAALLGLAGLAATRRR